MEYKEVLENQIKIMENIQAKAEETGATEIVGMAAETILKLVEAAKYL